MKELVFLLEGESEKALLQALLPRFLSAEIQTRFIPFEGKQDLERQLPGRWRGYLNPQARFVVIRDQDSAADCKVVKQKLQALCSQAGRGANSLIRIACREIETIYLADLLAVEQAFGLTGLAKRQKSVKFKQPDRLGSPSRELGLLTKGAFQKVSGARRLGVCLDLGNERSATFKHLLNGIRRLEGELLALP